MFGNYQPMFNSQYGYQQNQFSQPQTASPRTNKIYVVGVDDACGRYADYNSVMVYYLQDDSGIVEVFTDPQGRKSVQVKQFKPAVEQKQDAPAFVTQDEFRALNQKFETLESIVKGGMRNGQSDASNNADAL